MDPQNQYHIIRSRNWNKEHFNKVLSLASELGHSICGSHSSRVITGSNARDGVCINPPASNGHRCHLHGGNSSGPKNFTNVRNNAVTTGCYSPRFTESFLVCPACPLKRYDICDYSLPNGTCRIEQELYQNRFNQDMDKLNKLIEVNENIKSLVSKLTFIYILQDRLHRLSRINTISPGSLMEINRMLFSKEQSILKMIQEYTLAV